MASVGRARRKVSNKSTISAPTLRELGAHELQHEPVGNVFAVPVDVPTMGFAVMLWKRWRATFSSREAANAAERAAGFTGELDNPLRIRELLRARQLDVPLW